MGQVVKVSSSKVYLSSGCEEMYMPTSSFSFWSFSSSSSSPDIGGISGRTGFISSISPKRDDPESMVSWW